MSEANSKKIRFWCEIALSVITVVLGIVFICVVADIYYSGKGSDVIYSSEIVGGRLKTLIAPMVIWLAGVIACFVLSVVFKTENKTNYSATNSEKVKLLKSKLPSNGGEGYAEAKKNYSLFEYIRIALYGLASAFSVATAIITIVYISKTSNFAGMEINQAILGLVRNCVPFIAVSFLLFVATAIYEIVTAKAELKVMTKMLVAGKGNPHITSPVTITIGKITSFTAKYDNQIVWSVRGVVLAVAVIFIVLGILNGGVKDVLNKAINICTECIGLG